MDRELTTHIADVELYDSGAFYIGEFDVNGAHVLIEWLNRFVNKEAE